MRHAAIVIAALLLAGSAALAQSPPCRPLTLDQVQPVAPPRSDEALREQRTVAGFTIEYRYDQFGGWRYADSLVAEVRRDAPRTVWGDCAFAILLDGGLEPGGACSGETFRT